jgi:hypothetical protein
MRQLAKLRPTIPNPDVPRVIVAPSPSVFGLARMFESYGESTRPNLHVVATQREAYAIVGLKNLDFNPIDNDPHQALFLMGISSLSESTESIEWVTSLVTPIRTG